jgi:hypothetical protein
VLFIVSLKINVLLQELVCSIILNTFSYKFALKENTVKHKYKNKIAWIITNLNETEFSREYSMITLENSWIICNNLSRKITDNTNTYSSFIDKYAAWWQPLSMTVIQYKFLCCKNRYPIADTWIWKEYAGISPFRIKYPKMKHPPSYFLICINLSLPTSALTL